MEDASREIFAKTEESYRDGVRVMTRADVPFLVGGAYAFLDYTGIKRQTEDFDVFVMPDDGPRALVALSDAGFRIEVTDALCLAKAFPRERDGFIDLLFGLANGLGQVNSEWFANATSGHVLGRELPLCPPEEMIWSKSFVVERHRYDGADIGHLLRACASRIDWERRVAILHDAPIAATVEGESREIYTSLGSSRREEPLRACLKSLEAVVELASPLPSEGEGKG